MDGIALHGEDIELWGEPVHHEGGRLSTQQTPAANDTTQSLDLIGASRRVCIRKANPPGGDLVGRERVPVDENLAEELLPHNLVPQFVAVPDKSAIEGNQVLPESQLRELPDDELHEPVRDPPQWVTAPCNIALAPVEFLMAK